MKERPIIFSGEMVRAILEKRKTQTRRVIKPTITGRVKEIGGSRNWHLDDPNAVIACPFGKPGDRLWVRETWAMTEQGGDHPSDSYPVYRATDPDWETMEGWKWRPPIFMPRSVSRITLEIVGVRVERLQEINRKDAIAEGVDAIPGPGRNIKTLWNLINGKKAPWDSNPWVWVIEFRKVGSNEITACSSLL